MPAASTKRATDPVHWPQYIMAAARLALTAWREGRLSASPRRWLLDLRHLHSLMSSGHPVLFTATAPGHSLDLDRPTIPPATGPDLALAVFLASGNRLRFDTPSAPKVSVLLVLFNRAELTFKCLRSVLESQSVSLEIVVVDNHSTDETSLLLDRLDGVRIVRSPENVGFLRASNAAAMMARSEHLLFLNSDVELLPGSLAAALATLDQSSSIGAVGARLVLPDGTLQEAGGIVWSDGSCQGYGRGDSPSAPEYAFRRNVDYCSGAFLLTPRQVFTDLGAFDESFAPAYYEDADYCVRLWASDRRVVYEPRAVAVHVEFASSTSTSDAIRMQRERRATFVEKHGDWLRQKYAPSPKAVLLARNGGPRRPRLLFIDDRVPHGRLGSGYPRSQAIVHAATQLGYHVTLYPVAVPQEPWDEAYRDVPPETELMLGLGPERLTSFLKDRDGYYDVMMTSRPHNMQLVTPAISSLSDWKRPVLVYDAEALFTRRELGRDHLTGASISDEKARQLIDAEVGLARDCDLILTVSASERDEFRARGFPHVLTLGNSLDLNPGVRPFHERRGFLFVGAMTDDRSPNVDSALWLCREILPAVQRRIGRGARLTIAGRDGSTKVPHLAHDPSIDLVGMVDDLSPLYDRARVFLAPTRFGAGIPLKVQDAAARGVPVVCTSLLARQLEWRDGVHLLVADDVEEIAARCCALHEDEGLWTRIRQGALARVRDECSPDRFRATLAEAFRLAREVHQASASTGEALTSDSGSRSGLTNGSR